MAPISRHEFLQRTAIAGAACLLSSIEGVAVAQQKKIRVGVIGCGSVSTQYFPHLAKSPYVEFVSACDIIYERAQKRAAEFNVPNAFPHIDKTNLPSALFKTDQAGLSIIARPLKIDPNDFH